MEAENKNKILTQTQIDEDFNQFLENLKNKNVKESSLEKIKKSYEFARKAHEGQKRLTGENYINHPLQVAKIVESNGLSGTSICAALLHDVVEDTPVKIETIEKEFGESISNLVEGLTKINHLEHKDMSKEKMKVETLKKILLSSLKDVRILVVKLSDRLHNMKSLDGMSKDKRIETAKNTMEIFVPLAQKVGLYSLKWQLEDLCLKYLETKAFHQIKKKIGIKMEDRLELLKNEKIYIKEILQKNTDMKFKVESRIKNFYSIYKKIHKKGKLFEQIYDLYAIRIIVDSIEDCYKFFGIIQSTFSTIPSKIKDYISNPKSNGYQSIHTVILSELINKPIEIQIRTNKMNMAAEFGIAAHFKYKQLDEDGIFEKKISWLREIFTYEKEHKGDTNFLSLLKSDFFEEEIITYTPKNKLISLPEKSVILDFAYAIHTDIGDHARFGKINGLKVSLDTELKSGDIVEIITDKTYIPSQKFLKNLKSTKAKVKFRTFLKLKHGKNFRVKEETDKETELVKDLNLEEYTKYKIVVAHCCRVKVEEDVCGIIDKKELKLHNSKCEFCRVTELKKVQVNWRVDRKQIIELSCDNTTGILMDILKAFEEYNIKIDRISGNDMNEDIYKFKIWIKRKYVLKKIKKHFEEKKFIRHVKFL